MESGAPSKYKGGLDKLIVRYSRIRATGWANNVMERVVLMLSDQQLITGASILAVGFWKYCTITQYHFSVVFYLAISSFTVHQSTAITLERYLQEYAVVRGWRFAWMSIFFGMIVGCQVIYYNDKFLLYSYGMSTQCVWDNLGGAYHGENVLWLVISTTLLVWSYIDIASLMYPRVFDPLSRKLESPLLLFHLPTRLYQWALHHHGRAADELSERFAHWKGDRFSIHAGLNLMRAVLLEVSWVLTMAMLFAIFIFFVTISEILKSTIVDLWRVYTTLVWATSLLHSTRKEAAEGNGMVGSEEEWDFGQLLPILLLILPLMAAMEVYYGK